MEMKEAIFFICGIIIGSIWSFIVCRSVSRNKIIELNDKNSEIIKFHKERKFYNFTEAELESLYFILSKHVNFPNISNMILDLNNEFGERNIDPVNTNEYIICSLIYSYRNFTVKNLYRQKRENYSIIHFLEYVLRDKENQYSKLDINSLNKNFGSIASDDDIRFLKKLDKKEIGKLIRYIQNLNNYINNELKLRRNN